jgi:hypothetical protein
MLVYVYLAGGLWVYQDSMACVGRVMIDGVSSKTVQDPENAKNSSEPAETGVLLLPQCHGRQPGVTAHVPTLWKIRDT